MAQTFSECPAIHRIMLHSFFRWIIFFPKTGGPKIQHASPVILYFFQNIILFSHSAQCLQFIESHIRRGDLLNAIVQQYMLLYLALLFVVKIIEEDTKHVC